MHSWIAHYFLCDWLLSLTFSSKEDAFNETDVRYYLLYSEMLQYEASIFSICISKRPAKSL